ncbi:AMP-binding protein [Occallatibacter savannae]|uniref:AMP-binding protein n=1 Tax=Occallatibacter savannae TaxID=1002691 RepID=UPI000D6A04C3|nr:AMP-binding protein [Occallatibacter savannae]
MREHLATLLQDFRKHGSDIAIVRYQGVRRRETTYGELARLAGRFAAFLEERGIGKGDRLLLWAENGAEWVAAFYGCMLRGVIAVPLDAFGSADFARRIAADVKPRLAVGDANLMTKLHDELDITDQASGREQRTSIPTLCFEDWDASLPRHEAGPIDGLSRETPLQILFTSGTTGDPKGIVHTHGNVLASVGPIEQAAQKYLRYEKYVHPLRFLHTLPLSHVFGQTMGLWIPPIFAAEVHFDTRLVAPRLVETIRHERISVLAAVPRVMALIKAHLENTGRGLAERIAASKGMKAWKRWWVFRDVHHKLGFKFWALISGGGALAGPLEQFWNGLGFVVVQGYGMTETTALITLNHPFHVASGTIGKPLPGREVKIGPDGEVLVKGPMISTATWSGGELRQREDEWLATGDLAEKQATGELRFMGRKSEVIVTAAGVNVHPEDLEAALEAQPEIAASAVVALETPAGPEPCAVLATRGDEKKAAEAVDRANARLADYQRVRRWMIWPEPDLPRTSTGKVRRKVVAEWLANKSAPSEVASGDDAGRSSAFRGDWLYSLVAEIAGEHPVGNDELRLSEDFHLDSLGRVQLASALDERMADAPKEGSVDAARTLGDLRALLGASRSRETLAEQSAEAAGNLGPKASAATAAQGSAADDARNLAEARAENSESAPATIVETQSATERTTFHYPKWPWSKPMQGIRSVFLELVAQPFVWFLGSPRVTRPRDLNTHEPMLIICNHVTAYDGALVEYGLPGPMRRRVAAAMLGEMLQDYRRFRNPETGRFMLFGPAAYWLVTALYNVFPLPRRRDFQRSFAHAGEALDRGYNLLIFPEGTRSPAGELAPFRPGIGLLVKQAHAPVLPVALNGLGELKAKGRGWFRSGKLEVRIGQPMRFGPLESEAEITEKLHSAVAELMKSNG